MYPQLETKNIHTGKRCNRCRQGNCKTNPVTRELSDGVINTLCMVCRIKERRAVDNARRRHQSKTKLIAGKRNLMVYQNEFKQKRKASSCSETGDDLDLKYFSTWKTKSMQSVTSSTRICPVCQDHIYKTYSGLCKHFKTAKHYNNCIKGFNKSVKGNAISRYKKYINWDSRLFTVNLTNTMHGIEARDASRSTIIKRILRCEDNDYISLALDKELNFLNSTALADLEVTALIKKML